MITKLATIEQLKEVFAEILLNKTDKITKVSDGSVVNAIAFGNAKNVQKIMKDIAVLESHLFPDSGFAETLDNYARQNGLGQRFGFRQSSTYVYVSADPGTIYIPGQQVFLSSVGIRFDVESIYTVGVFGYGYIKLRSQTTGVSTNVSGLTITQIVNPPTGHKYCVNEYAAQYGSDVEIDDEFRKRSMEGVNVLSRGTISMLEQVFMKINENVLKLYYSGLDLNSRIVISILTENGTGLSDADMNDILLRCEKFLALTEMRPSGFKGYGITLKNVDFEPIDVSMRLELESSYDPDEVRKDIQVRLSKYLDYRYWTVGQKVEWDNMLEIVKHTDGVKYVNDAFFFPNNDVAIGLYKLPRIRGFQMLDLNGKIIRDIQGSLNPVYYPAEIDFKFQSTVLRTI